MFSLRALTLLTALSATAYSAGTLQVVNKCSYDVAIYRNKIGEQSQQPERHTLTAGGGSSPAYENPDKGQVIDIYSGRNDDQLSTLTVINSNKVWYDLRTFDGNPIDGHSTLASTDSSCKSIDSTMDLTQETVQGCDIAASFTLTLWD
ncbi:Bys1 family protein [Lasiodiplodia theobromae]|uniref:Bys1 family protein n=1 Tax=Lasiodiplodia theobromae TaxID=45133 RepID=UPI0015C39117|nr:Bys1 family protein [Lasiodiplodia theobromae]KAF4543410.1 Bys1 family protein [Lasiodiplodia theobromae]